MYGPKCDYDDCEWYIYKLFGETYYTPPPCEYCTKFNRSALVGNRYEPIKEEPKKKSWGGLFRI
jgi:hypothetical protein